MAWTHLQRDRYIAVSSFLQNPHNTLHWRHNEQDDVSNHQPRGCLLNRLFRRRSKKISKLRVTGLCVGNSPGPVNSPHKGPVTRKMFPFDDVIMRHPTGDVWGAFVSSKCGLCSAAVIILSYVKSWYIGAHYSGTRRIIYKQLSLSNAQNMACMVRYLHEHALDFTWVL